MTDFDQVLIAAREQPGTRSARLDFIENCADLREVDDVLVSVKDHGASVHHLIYTHVSGRHLCLPYYLSPDGVYCTDEPYEVKPHKVEIIEWRRL